MNTAETEEKTIRYGPYLDVLQLFLLPQLEEDDNMNIVFQQNDAPLHWAWEAPPLAETICTAVYCGQHQLETAKGSYQQLLVCAYIISTYEHVSQTPCPDRFAADLGTSSSTGVI
ncbi:hypothetical protein ANN_25880 [Periplaneta americana]|uniref:Uncharacterized protein n=1 Tax=Periplaneta americana TaxID=6978 RepID=A0ABQ8S4S1_PERAM|nr:hypothetical protein ANN_25880 [Periplaneta americana]